MAVDWRKFRTSRKYLKSFHDDAVRWAEDHLANESWKELEDVLQFLSELRQLLKTPPYNKGVIWKRIEADL